MVLPDLVAAVDALDPVALTGEAFRHVAANYNPLSGAGARAQGGRWNPPGSFATLYLALERETVVGEFHRMVSRAGLKPEDFLPRRFYRYEIELRALLDVRPLDARSALGLRDADLKSDDPSASQAIGDAAHYLGREGIIAPSAAGAGTVVAVFFDRLQADSYVRGLDFELWHAASRATEE